jgi:hypothetical protein
LSSWHQTSLKDIWEHLESPTVHDVRIAAVTSLFAAPDVAVLSLTSLLFKAR